jgi:threonine dehydrogenase-like Zn-dependent dehydrogenase
MLVAELYYNAANLETIYGLLVVKNGHLIAERYFNEGSVEQKARLQSVTKSFTSALAGIALDQGLLSSVDEKMIDFFPGEITCVIGTGPVGLGMTLFQTWLGAKVIAVDINPLALERAERVGAWKTLNPKETKDLKAAILDLTFGLGPDKSFDAISMGNQELFHTMLDVTRPGGTVVTVAHGDHGIDHVRERLAFHVDPTKGEFWGRNLCVRGNRACYFSDWSDMVAMVRIGFQIDRIITNQFPMEEAHEAYRRVSEGLEGKVILTQ